MLYLLDDIFIINNIEYTIESIVDGICTMEAIDIMNESLEGPLLIDESELPLPMYPDNYIGEMATVLANNRLNIRIQVNPDPGRIGNPYFKVFDSMKLKAGSSKVMRLHFFDSGMEYHDDKYLDWKPNKSDIKTIINILLSESKTGYTNWKMACWLWNLEYTDFEFDSNDIDRYMNGELDEQFKDHPSYVPSTTEIPETWEYNPPKGKNKRR